MSKDDTAVKSLESSLRDPLSYDAIDQMMQTISKKSGISPKQLRDKFMKKHDKTPDDYAKSISEAMTDKPKIKWIKDEHGPGYTSHDGERELVKHPKGWINRSTTDRHDYSDVWPTKKEAMAGKYRWAMKEDAPANVVGGGNIAGVGVGPQGEPGVYNKKKKDLVLAPTLKRKSFKDFVKGTK